MSTKPRIKKPELSYRPRVEWRTGAIDDRDPSIFAAKLQKTLQEFTDEGFNIVSQIGRGEAVIVTGQRLTVTTSTPVDSLTATISIGSNPGQKVPPLGETTQEVTYHYLETRNFRSEYKSVTKKTMEEALSLLQEHLRQPVLIPGVDIVPVNITVLRLTTFEPVELTSMLKNQHGSNKKPSNQES